MEMCKGLLKKLGLLYQYLQMWYVGSSKIAILKLNSIEYIKYCSVVLISPQFILPNMMLFLFVIIILTF